MHITKYFPQKVRKKPIFYVVHGQFAKNYIYLLLLSGKTQKSINILPEAL